MKQVRIAIHVLLLALLAFTAPAQTNVASITGLVSDSGGAAVSGADVMITNLATGHLLVAGQNASKNLNLKNDYLNFSPRLGVAYSLNDKTVIRSGFAIFYSNFWVDNGEQVSYPGWTGTQDFVDQGTGRPQPFTFMQGFPVAQVPVVTNPLELFAAASATRPLPVSAVTYNRTAGAPQCATSEHGRIGLAPRRQTRSILLRQFQRCGSHLGRQPGLAAPDH